MQGDYRFSFILPLRAEMLRKVRLGQPADSIQVDKPGVLLATQTASAAQGQ
jgi:hypothetical protein